MMSGCGASWGPRALPFLTKQIKAMPFLAGALECLLKE
jgi:hypothetical protein